MNLVAPISGLVKESASATRCWSPTRAASALPARRAPWSRC